MISLLRRRFCAAFLAIAGGLAPALADHPARIALIAGPITGHPKEAHEYEKSVILLKRLLETSPDLAGKVAVDAWFGGWPSDPAALDTADSIVLIGDGGDHREQDHPLYVGNRREQLQRQAARGCGVAFIHWTTFHPSRFHDQVTEWVGGTSTTKPGRPPTTGTPRSSSGTPMHDRFQGTPSPGVCVRGPPRRSSTTGSNSGAPTR